MNRKVLALAVVFGYLLLMTVRTFAQEATGTFGNNLNPGAVYVMTNQPQNAVMAFRRVPFFGHMRLVDTEPTQGAGNPVAIPPDPPTDALASQGSLVLDDDGDFLYAVNAGSNEISVLETHRRGLDFVQKVSSGGVRPISIALYNDVLYVLNEGGTPNITGFTVAENGMLTPIANSTQPLIGGETADPAQVGFNSDGTQLVVTEKAGNRLDVYNVDANGVAGAPSAVSSNGMTPFGFAFDTRQYIYVSEAFGGMPGMSAMSSYDADEDYDVVTGSLHNGQTASCWVVLARNFSFVSNTGSNTISSYRFDEDGALTLLREVAANTGAGSAPIDMAVSRFGVFLYVLESGSHTVSAYVVLPHGRLFRLGEFGTLPMGAQGIAAR
jgi:6-phosphogluconolactonase (cycloisomerase 2 family)